MSTHLGSDLPQFRALDPFLSCEYTYAFKLSPRRERLLPCRFLFKFLFCLSAMTSSLLIGLRTYVVIYNYTTTTIFRNQVLINIISIAIWNRNKYVLALAITIWVANVAIHLQSESLLSTQKTWNLIRTWAGRRCHKGKWPILILVPLGLLRP